MGYRSEVKAVFYVAAATHDSSRGPTEEVLKKREGHLSMLQCWMEGMLRELGSNEDTAGMVGEFSYHEGKGYLFECDDVKWSPGYTEVVAFNSMAEKYQQEYCEGELGKFFCYEFLRLGEDTADVESFSSENADWVLSCSRQIVVDF